ncbi:MAG: F0F1 ATP synthase subunit epsilon [Cellulosilyticaceae bacterium]
MANNKINLQIITPSRLVFDEMVDTVTLRTLEGDMGVWYDHEPVVTLLSYGVLKYKADGKVNKATIMSGFAEVTEDKVVILADSSELEHEIDVERAKAAKSRAEGRTSSSDVDVIRAQVALRKALIRLQVAEGK